MDIQIKQRKGRDKPVCEDTIYKLELGETYHFIGLADGQSRKQYCAEGGNAALAVVADYMRKQNLGALLESYSDEIQYELIHRIRRRLEELAQIRNVKIKEFSSTICALAVNPTDGNFIIIHLGDGCILGLTTDNRLRLLSMPECGMNRFCTYFTTSSMALSHVRLSQNNLKKYRAIYMMSEGISWINRNQVIESGVKRLLLQRDFKGLSEYMDKYEPVEDASLIMISL